MKKIFITLLILAAMVAGFFYYQQNQHAQPSNVLQLNGNIDIRQVALAFNDSGRVSEVLAEEGERVTKGQLLAKLDTEATRLQLAEAQAQIQVQQDQLARLKNGARPQEIQQAKSRVAQAQAQANKAKSELSRLQQLSRETNGRATSKQEIELAQSSAQIAAAQLAEQQQALALLQAGNRQEDINAAKAQLTAYQAKRDLLAYQLTQGELRSPVDAVVRSRLIEMGDMVSAQKTAFSLALTEPKWVRAYVSEVELGNIYEGMRAEVSSDSISDKIAGTIGYISSVAEFTPKTVQTTELRTSLVYEIRIIVADPDNKLRLGQPVSVTIPLQNQAQK